MIGRKQTESIGGLGSFVAAASLFILLRTRQYLAVDGALRCLAVYWRHQPLAGGNNHLLYFVNVFAWAKALSAMGLHPADAFDFVRMTQWMNALAAAGSISVLWLLSYRTTGNARTAWVISFAYAFSNAFLPHATSTAEPMMGLFWSLVSVLVVASGLARGSRPRLLIGGCLLLLAMATYESMVLLGPAELILIYRWEDGRARPRRYGLIIWFLGGCLIGGVVIYAPVYALSGTSAPLAMLRRFGQMGGGEQVYGGVKIAKVLNLPIGFANSIIPSLPPYYQGIRALLRIHLHDKWFILTSTTVFLLAGWLAWTSYRLALIWSELDYRQRLILECCGVALLCDLLALIYWDPIYDKLWLQPIAVSFFAWCIILTEWYRRYPNPLAAAPDALLIVLILASGLHSAIQARRPSTPCLAAARDLTGTLRPSDLLVSGWDPVSLLYFSFWGDGAKNFDLPAIAGDNGPDTLHLLEGAVAKTSADGGRVYFLGVLDMPEANWKAFLENRCHLPFRSFDGIRRCASPVAKYSCKHSYEVLWQLSISCYETRR